MKMQHPNSTRVMNLPTGISFTCALFGPIVPILRGDMLTATLVIVLSMLSFGLLAFPCWLYLVFGYNEHSLSKMEERGWIAVEN